MLNVISLGAGVQSTTMALMAAHGEIEPMPGCAIFADTFGEPQEVYDHLDWLEAALPFPIHSVSKGNLGKDLIDYLEGRSRTGANIPFFISVNGSPGIMNRSCTRDYKVNPVRKKAEQLAKIGRKKPQDVKITQWLGISVDEAHRMKESQRPYIKNRYPLIELRMSRGDCLAWIKRKGYETPPRSACWYCPYSSNERWRHLRESQPEEWQKAVDFDATLRSKGKWPGGKGLAYLHRSLEPLDKADLGDDRTIDMFGNECEGMCGV